MTRETSKDLKEICLKCQRKIKSNKIWKVRTVNTSGMVMSSRESKEPRFNIIIGQKEKTISEETE